MNHLTSLLLFLLRAVVISEIIYKNALYIIERMVDMVTVILVLYFLSPNDSFPTTKSL